MLQQDATFQTHLPVRGLRAAHREAGIITDPPLVRPLTRRPSHCEHSCLIPGSHGWDCPVNPPVDLLRGLWNTISEKQYWFRTGPVIFAYYSHSLSHNWSHVHCSSRVFDVSSSCIMHALFEHPLHCILRRLRNKVNRLLHSSLHSIDLHRHFLLPNEYVKNLSYPR